MSFNDLNKEDKIRDFKATNREKILVSLPDNVIQTDYEDYVITRKKLAECEDKFKTLVHYSMEPILISDLQGSILFVNNATARTLEAEDPNDLIGTNVMVFIAPESISDVINDFKQVSTGNDGYVAEYQVITLKGNRIILESIGKIIKYDGKTADLLSLKDITRYKQAKTDLMEKERDLKESDEIFKNPVENSPVGIYIYQDDRFLYINPRLALMFGYQREELKGKTIDSLVSPDDCEKVGIFLKNLLNNNLEVTFLEFNGIKRDGSLICLEVYSSVMKYQGKNAIYGTIIDITWKKIAVKELNRTEEQYHLIAENMKDVIWILNSDSGFLRYISPSIRQLCGYHSKELLKRPFYDIITSHKDNMLKTLLQNEKEEFLKNIYFKKYFRFEAPITCTNGSSVITETVANYFINHETQDIELIGITRDISDRKEIEDKIENQNLEISAAYEEILASYDELRAMEKERSSVIKKLERNKRALEESENSLKKAQMIAHLGFLEWNFSEDELYASDEFLNIFGLNSGKDHYINYIIERRIQSSYKEIFKNSLNSLIKTEEPFTLDIWIDLENRKKRAVRCMGEIQAEDNFISRHPILIAQDITTQKLMEEEIKEAYLEKETLLREIHHRVKNNMQIISSLLSMQSRNIKDPEYKALFNETKNRVRSLAYVHEFLYQSDNMNRINYKDYLQKITSYLLQSYNLTIGAVKCNIEVEDLDISLEKAVPCSLIITELLTNSFKYAFYDGRKGEIQIIFTYDPEKEQYQLHYRDNGPGFPEGFDHTKSQGFGTSLINGLIQQLSGIINIQSSSSGVEYSFIIPSRIEREYKIYTTGNSM